MKPRMVYIIGSVLAIAVFAFAIWHAMEPRTAPSATPVSSVGAPPPLPAPQQEPTKEETANVPRVEADELMTHFKAGDVTIIDVRDADSYQAGHIPGALHIPLARIEGEVPYLPKMKPIVTYCTWPNEESSAGAVLVLQHSGIQNARALKGGFNEWVRRGFPTKMGLS